MTALDSNNRTTGAIEEWFKAYVAKLVGVSAEDVDGTADFDSFGIDSMQGVDMVTALEAWLGLSQDLPLEYVFEASSISEAAQRISQALTDGSIPS